MKLFGEEVKHTQTDSHLNILQVREYEEIFFDVFEVELNNTKLPLEKISEYKGNPVVKVPIIVGETEGVFPFVLLKGKQNVIFNETSDSLEEYQYLDMIFDDVVVKNAPPIRTDDELDYAPLILETAISESRKEILEQIEQAKQDAERSIDKSKKIKLSKIREESVKSDAALRNTLEKARENLVDEFITISDKLRKELVIESRRGYSEMEETLDNKLIDICENLKSQLKDNFQDASNIFDNNIRTLVKELYSETVYPKLEKELNDIAFQIVEKVGDIESSLDKKLESKAEKTLVEGVEKELLSIRKANIELNDSLNKGVQKALSRVGNTDKKILEISEKFDQKISETEQEVVNYFDEKLTSIREETLNITDESRKYFQNLIHESRDNLLSEIRKIKDEQPIEYILETKKSGKVVKDWDSIEKEWNTKIHDKIENVKIDLRKYVSVYASGGGTNATQYQDGGTITGDLNVVGNYLLNGVNLYDIIVGGSDDYRYSWSFLSSTWSSEPSILASITGGDVYTYSLSGVNRYRFVPSPYLPTNDSFYSNFDGVNLTGFIISRG